VLQLASREDIVTLFPSTDFTSNLSYAMLASRLFPFSSQATMHLAIDQPCATATREKGYLTRLYMRCGVHARPDMASAANVACIYTTLLQLSRCHTHTATICGPVHAHVHERATLAWRELTFSGASVA
jgi:hypothetical protein